MDWDVASNGLHLDIMAADGTEGVPVHVVMRLVATGWRAWFFPEEGMLILKRGEVLWPRCQLLKVWLCNRVVGTGVSMI